MLLHLKSLPAVLDVIATLRDVERNERHLRSSLLVQPRKCRLRLLNVGDHVDRVVLDLRDLLCLGEGDEARSLVERDEGDVEVGGRRGEVGECGGRGGGRGSRRGRG